MSKALHRATTVTVIREIGAGRVGRANMNEQDTLVPAQTCDSRAARGHGLIQTCLNFGNASIDPVHTLIIIGINHPRERVTAGG